MRNDPFDYTHEPGSKIIRISSPSIIPMIRTPIDIEGGPFGFQMIDPPWAFATYSEEGKGKSAEQHYACMTLEDIMKMDFRSIADPKGCYFWLWATAPMLVHQLACLAAWGVDYVTHGMWEKTTKDGKGLAFGTGYVLRNCHEPFIIGKIGKPKVASRSVRSVIRAPRREHSRKPDEAYVRLQNSQAMSLRRTSSAASSAQDGFPGAMKHPNSTLKRRSSRD